MESTVVNTPVPVTELPVLKKESVNTVVTDHTDAGDAVFTAPPAVQTIEIDGRDGATANATDFLRQTAQASGRVQGT